MIVSFDNASNVKTFQVEDKINKLMPFRMDDEK